MAETAQDPRRREEPAPARSPPPLQSHPRVEDLRFFERSPVRLGAVFAAATLVVLAVMAIAFWRRGVATETEILQARLRGIAVAMARTVDEGLLDSLVSPGDVGSAAHRELERQLRAVGESEPGVFSVYVLRDTGEPGLLRFAADWVRQGRPAEPGQPYQVSKAPRMRDGLRAPVLEEGVYRDEWGATSSGYAPVVRGGRTLGLVGVDVAADRLEQVRQEVFRSILVLVLAAAALLLATAWAASRRLGRVLSRVIRATGDLAEGRLGARVGLDRQDETGVLGRHLDRMAEGLEERAFLRETFGRYVSREVAEELLSSRTPLEPGGEEREVTVLLSDLRGYSTLAESLTPPQTVDLLNSYLGAMDEVVEAHRGCVLEFLGDGILCVFGAPNLLTDHAERAVRCARAMNERLRSLNREWGQSGLSRPWRERGLGDLMMRVGVHTGTVVAGNLGSHSRLKYTVVGDPVNVAARCEALNKESGTDLLFTAETLARLSPELRRAAEDRGEHRVEGRDRPISVFGLAPSAALESRPAAPAVGGPGPCDRRPASEPRRARESRSPARIEDLRLWQRFHVRLTGAFALVVFAVLAGMAVTFYQRDVEAETEALRARIRAVAVTLATTLPVGVLRALDRPEAAGVEEHRRLVEVFADVAAAEPTVASIYVLRPTTDPAKLRFAADWVRRGVPAHPGQLYDATRADRMREGLERTTVERSVYADEWGPVLSGYAPLLREGERIGLVGVDVSAARLDRLRARALRLTACIFGAAMLAVAAGAVAVGRRVRSGVDRIAAAAQAIAEGRFEARAVRWGRDELGVLGQHLDRLAETLGEQQALRETFGRYVSPEVARELLSRRESLELGGEEREVSVLFADLRGWAALSSRLLPTQSLELLNAFAGALIEVVEGHRGCVLELSGDGVLAVFGAPGDLSDHAERAVSCARAIGPRLRALDQALGRDGLAGALRERGVPGLRARVGVHSGKVVAGNLGGRSRRKYAVIGDAVNVAARCEALNASLGTDLLVTRDTLARLPGPLQAAAQSRGEHRVKGRLQPVSVYTFDG